MCLQPEGAFSLTVTWTPTEEGGSRELIIFNANGVLKHQAVLLGRAEAPKKKKVNVFIHLVHRGDQQLQLYSNTVDEEVIFCHLSFSFIALWL